MAGHKISTGVPSIMNMDVEPVFAVASVVAMVIALRYCFVGAPNIYRAVAAKLRQFSGMPGVMLLVSGFVEQLNVAVVMSSLLFLTKESTVRTFMIWAGSKE